MSRYRAADEVALRHWGGEGTALARLPAAGTTHLIGVEALAVLQAATHPQGLALCEIAHVLGLGEQLEGETTVGLQRIIDGLIQSGLLCRIDCADDNSGPEPRR